VRHAFRCEVVYAPTLSRLVGMRVCETCGGNLRRVPRAGLWDRIRYAAMYRCVECGRRAVATVGWSEIFSLTARCPRCGTYDLAQNSERDRVDQLHKNPFSLLQALFGAPLYHCRYCRLQFYDFRRRVASQVTAKGI